MNSNQNQTREIQAHVKKVAQLKQCLEKANVLGSNKLEILKYQNFWCRTMRLESILHYQTHFQARDSDIILASLPKTGTTWLKSLLYSIVNRSNPDHQPLKKNSPLLTHNPHELVYYLEMVYSTSPERNPNYPTPQQLIEHVSPRLLNNHIPYPSNPKSIRTSSCKIVYIARNPLDTCVSQWHWHLNRLKKMIGEHDELQPPSIEEFFEDFCQGKFPYGPYFDHVLGFWKQSLVQPNKVLFLKFEDLKSDRFVFHLKKLAEFVGYPFTDEEESKGVINDIMELCSITNLKDLNVNKTGSIMNKFVEKKDFFRKGEVGDWINYFTPVMEEKINLLMQEKLGGTDLSFEVQNQS